MKRLFSVVIVVVLAWAASSLLAQGGNAEQEIRAVFDQIKDALLKGDAAAWGKLAAEDSVRDRKSTRLNSSHSQISYAVFCLKKKKRRYRKPPAGTSLGWKRASQQTVSWPDRRWPGRMTRGHVHHSTATSHLHLPDR